MPRRIRSLKDTTLSCIAKTIDYWNEMIPEDPENYLYLLSPFEVLDHGLTQQLFDALIENGTFLPRHIHLLFHSNLDSIDLSKCTSFKLGEGVLKTLLKRCKKIKSFKLSGRTRYSRSLLNSIPCKYPSLQHFIFTHESISDDLIESLAASCPTLVSLQSSTCSKLKRSSFECISKLQNIQALTLGNADALDDVTLLLILNSCQKLKQLHLPMTNVNLKFLTGEHIFSSIQTLDFTLSDAVDDDTVEKIAVSFPFLKVLCLSNCQNVTAVALEILAERCRLLESLNISYCGIKEYSDIIKTFLMKAGHNLHSVDFSGISKMKTSLFACYCSHLEKLFLNHCPFMATEWISSTMFDEVITRNSLHNDRFLNDIISTGGKHEKYSLLELCPLLHTVQLDFRKKKSYDSEFDLQAVLHGARIIQSLSLVEMPNFNDEDILTLASYMDTSKIKCLNISGNANVTSDGIWHAIENMGSLETIEIRDCDVIKTEFDQLRQRIASMGYDVNLIGYN